MDPETPLPEPGDRPKWISIGLVIAVIVLVYLALAQPGANEQPRPSEPQNQLAQDRADEAAGFPRQQEPDEPPRGPGP